MRLGRVYGLFYQPLIYLYERLIEKRRDSTRNLKFSPAAGDERPEQRASVEFRRQNEIVFRKRAAADSEFAVG